MLSLAEVAPFAGAWIEITLQFSVGSIVVSLPSRVSGLILSVLAFRILAAAVAPFAGAWIEIRG